MHTSERVLSLRKAVFILSQVILLVAFGCGPAATPILIALPTATEPAPQSTSTLPSTPEPPETSIPTVTPTPFVPRGVVQLFSHVPLTGERAALGTDILHGAELAIQQLSGPLNELGYQVELVSYDDQNIREVALANAAALVADQEILCGVGHYDGEVTIAASNIYHQARLPFVAPAVTAPFLTDRSYLEVNRVLGHADGQGLAAAQFAEAQGYSSMFIISQRAQNSILNAERFRAEAGRLGIKRLGSVLTSVNEENMDRIVNQIVDANPDVVYVSTSARQAMPLLVALRAAGYMGAILGTDRLDSRSTISAAGPTLLQGGGLYYTLTNPPTDYYPNGTQFIEDFNKHFGTPPRSLAARAYDAAGICLKAIEEATRANGGELPTRAEVARAIRALQNYKGITGTYNFNNQGDPAPAQYYVYQVVSTDSGNWEQNPIVATVDVNPP